jgi:hypothetical protein
MTVRRLFVFILALALFAMAVRETLDPDLWWHLRTGQVILQEGIPRQDIFSYTVQDHEWVTHEWLSQAFMWLVYTAGGLPGLMVAFALLTAATLGLVYLTCDGRPYLAAFVTLLAAVTSSVVWGARPQMFNLLFAAAFVYLVEGFKDGQVSRRQLWLLPLVTLLWSNFHSGYLLGIVILAVYVLGEAGQLLLGRPDRRGMSWSMVGWLAILTVISFLVAAVNPNGPELWLYPFFTLGSRAMQQYILEWHSPDFHQVMFWPFGAMVFVTVAGFLINRQRPALTDLLLFAGTAAAGLLSARHIPLFAVVSAPILARYLFRSLDGTSLYAFFNDHRSQVPDRRWAVVNMSLVGLATLAAVLWLAVKVGQNEAAVAGRYPVAAVNAIEQSDLAGRRIYNSYNWGGYLIWRGVPVFVDGRADVYGDEFLLFYRRTYDMRQNWQELLDEYAVDYVLIESFHPLATLLEASAGWIESYRDPLAVIFVRER